MITRTSVVGRHPVRPLGEVVEFLDNFRVPITESERRPGPYPYYGANGQLGTVEGYIFDEPLVLLAEDGGFFDQPDRGVAYRILGKSWVNNHAHVLRPTKQVDLAFLQRVLENYDVSPFVSGTTRGKLTKAGASQIPIPVPPLKEQRRIAGILDQADGLRAKRRVALAKLDSLTHSIFLDMFGDPVTNPKGWPNGIDLGDVADIASGITKGRVLRDAPTRPVPYLAVLNVQDRALKLETVKRIEATASEITRYQLQKGDLLLTEGGDPDKLGRGTLWNGEISECIHQNHIFRVRLRNNATVDPLFLNWLIGSNRGKQYFLRSAKQTTGIASINMTQLKGFQMLMPPFSIQREFADRMAALQQVRNRVASHERVLDALFASLQDRAFRGAL